MKHLYFLISFVVLAACATGGAKYSGGEITIDPAVQSNRHVTYMPVSVNELAKATAYVESKGVSLTESTEDTKHTQQIAQNNADRIKNMFALLYETVNNNKDLTEVTNVDVINMYKISGIKTIDSCDVTTSRCIVDSSILKNRNDMINDLKSEQNKTAINDIISKFFVTPSLSFKSQNLSDVSFTTSNLSSDSANNSKEQSFKYIFENNKIKQIKITYTDQSSQTYDRTSDDSANFGSIEVVSLAKDLIELNKTQKFIGLSYADFGFINKDSNSYGIFFGDYSNKRIIPETGKTEFTTVDSKTGKTVQIESPTFSGKAAMLIKDGKTTSFQEGVAELQYAKDNSTLTITSESYTVKAKSTNNTDFNTVEFTAKPQESKFDNSSAKEQIKSNLYYYSNNGKSIQEAAGTLNYIQNDNTYFKSAFGVAIPRQ